MAAKESVNGRALKCYTACYDGKLDEVKRIVAEAADEGADEPLDVNAEIHGGTAFAAAVQNGHIDIIEYLAGCGAQARVGGRSSRGGPRRRDTGGKRFVFLPFRREAKRMVVFLDKKMQN